MMFLIANDFLSECNHVLYKLTVCVRLIAIDYCNFFSERNTFSYVSTLLIHQILQ